MKPRAILSLTTTITTIVLFAGLAPQAHAVDLYWDADANASAATGGTGNWDVGAGGGWRTGSSVGALQSYDNTAPSNVTAQFGGNSGTVTLIGTINTGGLTFTQSGYNLTATAGTLNINPVGGSFVYNTTTGGTNTITSTVTSPGGTLIAKTGPGTLVLVNGGGGAGTVPALYTVTGGTFNSGTLTFDSILSMPAGNRLGAGAPAANPVTPQVVLDAGTIQFTQTGTNNLANTRGLRVNAAGGAIVDGGGNSSIPSYIVNNSGPGNGLYMTNGTGATLFQGAISGAGNLIWTGAATANTATFQAVNTYTGLTTVTRGTVKLDFTGSNTGASRMSSSAAFVLNSGTLSVLGTNTAAQTTSQTINGLTISGTASVVDTVGAAGLSSSLALGTITRTNLGTLNFTLPATGSITSITANTNGIIGGWATVGGTDWASSAGNGVTPGNITALASYLTTTVAGDTAANYLSTSNVDVTSTQTLSGAVTINSARFNAAAANTINLTGTNIISSGGVLVTTNVGANASAINGGTLEGASGTELSIIQNNTTGVLTIGSLIADNTSATPLIKNGAGTLVLNNTNSYTGGTQLRAGTLRVAQNGALASGDLVFVNSATLQAGGANVVVPNTITLGATSDVFDTNGNTLNLSGAINNTGAVNSAMKAAGNGTLVLSGTLNITGNATDTNNPALMLANRNGANFDRGTVTITGTGSISRISTGWDHTANVLNFASTGTVTMATDLVSGQGTGGIPGVGVVNFTTGTLNLANINMANWDDSYGGFTMTGGTINTTNLRNGGNGNGNCNSYTLMTGGTINVAEVTTLSRNGNGTNVLYIHGADAQFNEGNNRFNLGFSTDSTGVITIDSGLLTVGSNLSFAEANTAGTTAILNLNGGIVRPNTIVASANGNSILNFNGGTLQANISNANFMGGLANANIFSGGAVIDSNGAAITISQVFKSAAGNNGVTSVPLSTGGAGYLGAPVVKITGGGGTGATAVAAMSGGVVTGITVTSAGTNYTGAPTVTLVGGGATTAATVGTATFAANAADGGLTKKGFSTLTLTGASTYLGNTTVTEGTLATNNLAANGVASGLGAGTTVVLDGTTLQYTGASNNNGFNRTITVGTNGGTLDNIGTVTGFVFYGGSLSGSNPINFIDSSSHTREWLITGNSPGFSGDVYVGSGFTGSGMLQYRSNNPFPFGTGVIYVNGGTLTADDGATVPSTLGNNFVLYAGFLGTQQSNMTYTGAISVQGSSSIGHAYTGTVGTVTLSGVIDGDSGATLTIDTASSVTLTNTNLFPGSVDVFKGKLLVDGSLPAGSFVTIEAGGTLGGSGTVNGPVATMDSASTIAPGTGGIGTLTTGATSLTGTLAVDVSGTTGDKLAVHGNLNLAGAVLTVNPLAPLTGPVVIAQCTGGTISGTFSVPPGYAVNYTSTTATLSAVAAGTYATWATANGINGQPASGDFDKDGLSNLMEYALGLNPTSSSVPAGTFSGGLLSFTKGTEAKFNGDVTFEIEQSTALSGWVVVVPDAPASPTISYTLPPGQPKEFARLKVTQN
ncbi:MAG: autotransporter-associated beta strand repeat-containing protein [Luteolibacter sp.]|uniref:beta strand repeat-containing protein n=1 Tax=Luteolibacter sp. TaxID=1962973 RepID=UPI0032676AD4